MMPASALVLLLASGTRAEETAEQRYVRAARARCPPPAGDDLYDWRLEHEGRASLLDARAAVEAYACLLETCILAPRGVERCRLSAADGRALRAAAARAVVARGGSTLAAPGLLARALLEAVVAGAAAISDPQPRRRTRGAARVHLAAALASMGDLAAAADAAAAALTDTHVNWEAASAADVVARDAGALAAAATLQRGAVLVAAGGAGAGHGAALLANATAALGHAGDGAGAAAALRGFVLERLGRPAAAPGPPWADDGLDRGRAALRATPGLARVAAAAARGPPAGRDAEALSDALERRGFEAAAAAQAARAAPFGAAAPAARLGALLRLPAVPRSRRWLAAALDALEAGLDASDDNEYRGPLFVGGADESTVEEEACALRDLPRLLDAVLAKLRHLHVDDDVDVATFYDAAPRGPSLVRRLFERVRRVCPAAAMTSGEPRPAAPAGAPIRVGFLSGRLRRSPAVRVAVAAAAALGRDPGLRSVAC